MRFLWWCKYMLLPGDISLGAEQFGQQDGAARRAAQRVVREADELIIVLRVGAQTADADGHAVLKIAVEPGLGAVLLFKVVQELLWCGGEIQLLVRGPRNWPNQP